MHTNAYINRLAFGFILFSMRVIFLGSGLAFHDRCSPE